MQENTTAPGNAAATAGDVKVTAIDFLIAACVILEVVFLYVSLITRQTYLGYLLPIAVTMTSVTITALALKDTFRPKK